MTLSINVFWSWALGVRVGIDFSSCKSGRWCWPPSSSTSLISMATLRFSLILRLPWLNSDNMIEWDWWVSRLSSRRRGSSELDGEERWLARNWNWNGKEDKQHSQILRERGGYWLGRELVHPFYYRKGVGDRYGTSNIKDRLWFGFRPGYVLGPGRSRQAWTWIWVWWEQMDPCFGPKTQRCQIRPLVSCAMGPGPC